MISSCSSTYVSSLLLENGCVVCTAFVGGLSSEWTMFDVVDSAVGSIESSTTEHDRTHAQPVIKRLVHRPH